MSSSSSINSSHRCCPQRSAWVPCLQVPVTFVRMIGWHECGGNGGGQSTRPGHLCRTRFFRSTTSRSSIVRSPRDWPSRALTIAILRDNLRSLWDRPDIGTRNQRAVTRIKLRRETISKLLFPLFVIFANLDLTFPGNWC